MKIDHCKSLSTLNQPSRRQPALVDVPAMNFLMLDRRGARPHGGHHPTGIHYHPHI